MDKAIIIFVRHPELGKVKTRLAASVGNEKALLIYKLLIAHTYKLVKDLPFDVYVYYTVEIIEQDVWNSKNIIKKRQKGNDLGEKMQNAFSEVFFESHSKVVIIGSDCYELTTQIINEAFDATGNDKVVIGPAKDGGYYLLGLYKHLPEIFKDISWSTAKVLEQTTNILQRLQYPYQMMPMLNDIDEEKDLNEELKMKAGL